VIDAPPNESEVASDLIRIRYRDDYRDTADTAMALLKVAGFDARACYDGESALAEAANFQPGICFADLNMPGMDGDELVNRLRSMSDLRPIFLVAVTAMSSSASSQRIRDAGFDLHMVKPVDPQKLVGIVDAFLQLGEAQTPRMVGFGIKA